MELLVAAAAAAAAVVAAVGYVRLTRMQLEAARTLRPPRLHVGGSAEVQVSVRNAGTGSSPVVGLADPFDGGQRWARFQVAPLRPGQAVAAGYRLAAQRRGVYGLGPLELRLCDPFGLASRPVQAAPAVEVVVYPRIEAVGPLVPGPGDRRHTGEGPSPARAGTAGDLYALREYQVGDDLRRVHWRSTAKRDELMIRQDEVPMQGAATVLLDLRHDAHTEGTLETAVSAAASIVHAAWRRHWPVRLVAGDEADSGFGVGRAHVEAILERLAVAGVDRGAVRPTLGPVAPVAGGASVVAVVTTDAVPDADVRSAARAWRGSAATVVVLVETVPSPPGTPATLGPALPGATVVRVGAGRPLATAWAAAMAPGRGRAAATR